MHFHVDSSASTKHSYFVLQIPGALQVSLYSRPLVLQGIAAGIGTSNFLRAFQIVSLNSSSAGSMKSMPRNVLALSSFGFSIAHFCFSFRIDDSDMSFHISGHRESGLDVVCFRVSRPPGHVYPSGGFSSHIVNLVKPVHVSVPINVPIIVDAFLQHYIQ